MEEARVHVSPEFINGLGEMINFHPLGSGHFREIVETQLDLVLSRAKIIIKATPAAELLLVD